MSEINFVNFAIDEKDKEKLDNVVKTVSEKPKIMKYKREAKFLRNFTLALMRQYKHYPKPFLERKPSGKEKLKEIAIQETAKPASHIAKKEKVIVKKTEVKKPVPKIPVELELDEFLPSPPKEIEIPLPEIKMPEAPHKPLNGSSIPEEIHDGHIPMAPKPEEKNEILDAPKPSEDKKEALPALPKFPD